MKLDTVGIKSRLRRFRTNSGVSTSEIASVGGVSESTIRRYDDPSDPRDPSLIVIAKVCAHYGISLDWLVFGSNDNVPDVIRFRQLMDNLSTNLPLESQIGFAQFVQGVVDLSLQAGRRASPLVELESSGTE